MQRRFAWTYFAAAGVLLLLLLWRFTHLRGEGWSWSEREDEPSVSDGGHFVPAQAYGEEGLQVAAEVTPIGGGRKIVLRLEDGEVVLTLFDATKSDSELPMAFGKARLEAKDARAGGAFVAAFTRFIGAPERRPRIDAAPLVALELEYVRIAEATGNRPETMKLFLHGRRREAEVFFDLWPDGVRAAFLEKDEIYRRDLVAILAETLRDGPPPRRTVETDPHLASTAPLFSHTNALPDLPDGKDVTELGFVESTLIGALEQGDHTRILRWKDTTLPPDVLESLQGEVLSLTAAPRSPLAAIVLGTRQGEAGSSRSLLVIDAQSGAISPLFTDPNLVGQGEHPVWSPDGKRLAIGLLVGDKPGIVRVLDVAQKTVLASATVAGLPEQWGNAGLLAKGRGDGLNTPPRWFVWFPGTGEPSEYVAPRKWDSPDGLVAISFGEDAVFGLADVKFEPSRESDRDAIADLLDLEGELQWTGPHALLLESDELFALDVETMRLRYLTDQPGLVTLVTASRDGKQALLRDDEGRLHAAR